MLYGAARVVSCVSVGPKEMLKSWAVVLLSSLSDNILIAYLLLRIQRRRRSPRTSCRGSDQAKSKRGMLQGAGGEAVVAKEKIGKCSGGRAPKGAANPVFLQTFHVSRSYVV